MSRLFAFIFLFGLCVSVFAAEDCVFDIETFIPQPDSDNAAIDFSKQSVATLTEGGKRYNYLTGPFKIKTKLDKSYKVIINVRQLPEGQSVRDIQHACQFAGRAFAKYFMPFTANHSDLPSDFNFCTAEPGTTINFFPANNTNDLTAESHLTVGRFSYELSFTKDNEPVGGIHGILNVLRDN